MRDAGFLLQCVHCSGNAGRPERIFGSRSRWRGLFLGYLAFFSVSLDSAYFGVAFSGLLSVLFAGCGSNSAATRIVILSVAMEGATLDKLRAGFLEMGPPPKKLPKTDPKLTV